MKSALFIVRSALRVCGWFLAAVLFAGSGHAAEQPNLIFILADAW